MTKQEFINEIYKYLIKYSKDYNILCLSVPIAQACKESAFGTSELALNANNFFGLKYKSNICNDMYVKNAVEQRPDGTYYIVSQTQWCKFDTFEAGVKGYLDFINNSRYSNLKGVKDYNTYINNIKNDGYCTSLTYVNSIINDYILKYDLDKFDKEIIEQTKKEINIIDCTSTHNTTQKTNRKIEYIVIHYTASTTSKKGTAKNTANYFKTTTRSASADFVVDDEEIVQYNRDILNRYCWSVGGNKYQNLTTTEGAKFYGICQNNNSISVEICSNKLNTSTLNATDTDWYFTQNCLNNAINLIKYLSKTYNIPLNNVIMHHHVNGKICPSMFCINEAALSNFYNFKKLLTGETEDIVIKPENNFEVEECKEFLVKVEIPDLSVRRGPGMVYTSFKYTGIGIFTIVAKKGDWYLLKTYQKNKDGWIHKNYCKKMDDVYANTFKIKVNCSDLPIYYYPDKNSEIRCFSGLGVFTIVDTFGDWYLLKTYKDKRDGWIHKNYCKIV